MYLEAQCNTVTIQRWNELMKGTRRASYRRLVSRIKRELPDLYRALCLDYPNPYDNMCWRTATHFIFVHSAIEYFIHK